MYLYIILALVTVIEIVLTARMDIKERKIYTFPIFMISLSWLSYLFSTREYTWQFLLCYGIFNLSAWLLFNQIKMWGEGDSDLFLALSNILLATVGNVGGCTILFLECMSLIYVMAMAICIGFIESRVKKEKLNLHSKVAVAPGFAVVIIVILVVGVIGRII